MDVGGAEAANSQSCILKGICKLSSLIPFSLTTWSYVPQIIFGSLINLARHIVNQIYVNLLAMVLSWLYRHDNLSTYMAFQIV